MPFSAPRYSSRPFPPYAFRAGANPHPTAAPDGHSYRPPGEAEPAVVLVAAEHWPRSADYLYGCDLYNHGYWWEAHEAWEGLWHLVDRADPQGRFLQGLIQVSAAALKLAVGQRRGAGRLLDRGRRHLSAVVDAGPGPRFMGLALEEFLGATGRYYGPRVREGARLGHDPTAFPYIMLGRTGVPMSTELAKKQCVPCKGGVPPLDRDQVGALLGQLDGWRIEQACHLTRTFEFPDFATALEFTNRVGAVAEDQNHHPDIHLSWGKVEVEVWTHKINGLTESDFIFAAKVDELERGA